MSKEMRSALNRLRREGRIVTEPETWDGGESYTVWSTRYGITYVTDIWEDGEIVYAEQV